MHTTYMKVARICYHCYYVAIIMYRKKTKKKNMKVTRKTKTVKEGERHSGGRWFFWGYSVYAKRGIFNKFK